MHRATFALAFLLVLATHPLEGGAVQQRSSLGDPATAAVIYSEMEAKGLFDLLYQYMHTDAQAIVPQYAVVGWYRDDFAPRGPQVITVTGAQVRPWNWGDKRYDLRQHRRSLIHTAIR